MNGTIDQLCSASPLPEQENIDYNLNKIGEIGTPAATDGKLSAGLGAGREHSFQVLEAGCEQRRRHAQSAHRLLAERHQGQRRNSHPVQPCHRHSSHHPRSCGHQGPRGDRGIKQQPIEGTSLAYSIDDAKAPTRHTVQYYYIFGSRSIYDHGWKAELALPNAASSPEMQHSNQPFDENAWELYNLNDDLHRANRPGQKVSGETG